MLVIPDHPTLIAGDVMRFRETAGSASKPGTIEVHIIRPGRGSSGYYLPEVLKKACDAGVYSQGMHMHIDHPTRQQEKDQPARTVSTIAAVLAENARYRDESDPAAWDGPGPYALAEVRPKFLEDLKWLSGKIGVSHYVDGRSEEGDCPDGKKGRLIKELIPSPFNSVDFVTIPGAGGHSRSIAEVLKESQENNQRKPHMADGKQETLTLSEIRTKFPEVVVELKKQLAEELKIESLNESQKNQLKEASDRIKALEKELEETRGKVAEGAARTFVAAEIAKVKIPETAAKGLTETLIKAVPLAEDGSIDTVKFGVAVTEAIKGKQDEIAAILKESGYKGIHDNGGSPGPATTDLKKAKEDYIRVLIEGGMTKEQAEKLAEA